VTEAEAAAAPGGGTPAAASVPLPLRRNFSWSLLGNVLHAAAQWGVLVALAKLAGPEMLGQFVLGLAIANPVIVFAGLDLRVVQATDARGEFAFGEYLGLRLALLLPALALIAGLGFALHPWGSALVVAAVGAAKAAEALSDTFYGLFQQRERMDHVGRSLVLRGAASLGTMTVVIALGGGVLAGSAAMAVAMVAVVLLHDLPAGRRVAGHAPGALAPRWNRERIGGLVRLGLPMGAVAMLIALQPNVPRYFLADLHGERALGIYSALAYLVVVGSTVKTALDHSAAPRLARHWAEGDRRGFLRLLGGMSLAGVGLGVAGVLAAVLLGPWLLRLFYTSEYAPYTRAFTWVMIAGGLGHVAFSLRFAILAARRSAVQVALFAGTVAVTALACRWLVPDGGVTGAAQALAAGSLFQVTASALAMAAILRRFPRPAS
jgi:O-antigen/teichoic acid export membrane protein